MFNKEQSCWTHETVIGYCNYCNINKFPIALTPFPRKWNIKVCNERGKVPGQENGKKGTFLRPLCLKPNHENGLCPAIMTLGPGLPLVKQKIGKNKYFNMHEWEWKTDGDFQGCVLFGVLMRITSPGNAVYLTTHSYAKLPEIFV